jgi:hypothetical protein
MEHDMTDLTYLLLLAALFASAFALIPAFDHLMKSRPEERK